MFTKIKEFLFGKDPVQSPVAAPYKVETPEPKVEVVPVSTEVSVATAPEANQVALARPKAPARTAKPKASPKPKAPRKPIAK